MKLQQVLESVNGTVITDHYNPDKEAESGFVGDLLSVVMGKAQDESVWITIQSHINIVAVAALVDMACIIVTEGFKVDEEALAKANTEEITIMTTSMSSYEACAALALQGLT